MALNAKPLIAQSILRERVAALAEEIARDYEGRVPLLLGVLKGALHLTSDLARAMPGPVEIGFIRARSYEGAESTGSVTVSGIDAIEIHGRHVLVVEDILDTGRTLNALAQQLQAQDPASLRVCTLLDKPSRRIAPFEAHYTGFTIPDQFVVGYGLDYNERYRELPEIYVYEP